MIFVCARHGSSFRCSPATAPAIITIRTTLRYPLIPGRRHLAIWQSICKSYQWDRISSNFNDIKMCGSCSPFGVLQQAYPPGLSNMSNIHLPSDHLRAAGPPTKLLDTTAPADYESLLPSKPSSPWTVDPDRLAEWSRNHIREIATTTSNTGVHTSNAPTLAFFTILPPVHSYY